MFSRIRMAVVAGGSSLAMLAAVAPSAHAGLLSLAPGACGQQMSEPFAQFGDANEYALVPGGSFEPGTPGWRLGGGAQVVAGGHGSTNALSLPAGRSAISPAACTGIDHPSARVFLRNQGPSSSALTLRATCE